MKYLEWLKSEKRGARTSQVNGIEFEVYKNVFPPAGDTALLVRGIPNVPCETVLDIGCGCGVNGIVASVLHNAVGVSVDINPAALINTQDNAQKHGANINVFHSNMFSGVPTGQYDLLVANGPHHEGRIEDPLDYGCYGAMSFTTELLVGAAKYMHRRSRLLVVHAMLDGRDSYFEPILRESRLKGEIVATARQPKRWGTYQLYCLSRE